MYRTGLLILLILSGSSPALSQSPAVPPQAINTQNPDDVPPTPMESLAKMTLPAGFSVSLFAGEPDVHQPLAFTFDDRGRLWVIENYSYPEWNDEAFDRIVIFEDTDQDGQFDRKKIFLEKGRQLTGIEIGFGGIWCTAAPYLIFIPDADRDDKPDSPPQILLDGFNLSEVGHNVVNGLRWGPDGWLYGRHGIKATSHVGAPGTAQHDRILLNCSIWRFHPTNRTFEVVSHGTTNPWGFDYDDYGEMFFTNNVIGHLWHLLPGARYQRMYPVHFNSNTYIEMAPVSDHLHFAGGLWSESRKETGKPNLHGAYGGGHSHCGGMIYLGDNWPDKYRGSMFLCNTHGKRVNMDKLLRQGSSYVAQHGEDFLLANNDWFRGIEMKYGPDGGVFLTDWTDLGECHDRDGIHRRSGRIFKIVYGKPSALDAFDLQSASATELVELQDHKNDWYVRHARRILQERAAQGGDLSGAAELLQRKLDAATDIPRKLRYVWCLHALGKSKSILSTLLNSQDEHLRVWGVRLLDESGLSPQAVARGLTRLAAKETSGLVQLHVASVVAHLPIEFRWAVAEQLTQSAATPTDNRLLALLWYAVEPAVLVDVRAALDLAVNSKLDLLQQFVARRIAAGGGAYPREMDALLQVMLSGQKENHTATVLSLLTGLNDGLRGCRQRKMPPDWPMFARLVQQSSGNQAKQLVQQIGVVFGDGVALEQVVVVVRDQDLDSETRRTAVQTLVTARSPLVPEVLQGLINDRAVQHSAIRGLGRFDHPQTPKLLLARYHAMDLPLKHAVIDALSTREDYAASLMTAMRDGTVLREHVTPQQARQLVNLGSDIITQQLSEYWGAVQVSSQDQQAQIDALKELLAGGDPAKVDLSDGRTWYKKRCANCHKLFGAGTEIGPDLTGSGRANVDYALQNVVTPSAVVAAGFQVSVVVTIDGRVITGVVRPQGDQVLVIQTEKEQIRLPRNDVEEIRKSKLSLMPENLLKDLTDDQIRNLFGYLASPTQVSEK